MFVGVEYQEAYRYVPFLYIGVIFLGLSGFIGTGYLGTKHTEGILWTSLAGSLINTVMNIVLMPVFGLQIAGISSVCAYFTMWLVRTWQTRKFFKITLQWALFIPLILLTLIVAIGIQFDFLWLDISFEVLAISLAIFLNRKLITSFVKTCLDKRKTG